jgi:hypothetical protein
MILNTILGDDAAESMHMGFVLAQIYFTIGHDYNQVIEKELMGMSL